MKSVLRAFLVAALMTFFVAARPLIAAAHTDRHVGGYGLVIGWGTEPTYVGYPNSVQLLLHGPDEKPVVDLGDTLQVEVTSGTEKRALTLEPHFEVGEFGEPGDYRAFLIPTAPGNYTFRFFGTIKGVRVNLSLTSGATTFSPVENADQAQFPQRVPAGSEIAGRLDRELPRIEARIAAARKEANDDASSARTFGVAGVAVGALGLLTGGVALTRKR